MVASLGRSGLLREPRRFAPWRAVSPRDKGAGVGVDFVQGIPQIDRVRAMKIFDAKTVLIVMLLGLMASCSQPNMVGEPALNQVEAPVEAQAKEVGERAPKRIIFLIEIGRAHV